MQNKDFKDRTFVSMSYDEKINPWTIDVRTGVLCRVNKEKKTYVYYSFQCVSENPSSDNFDVIEKNSRLFFLPNKFKSRPAIITLGLPEMIKTEIELMDLPSRDEPKDDMQFTGMISVGDYIFFVPCAYPAIVRVDTRDLSVTYIDKWKIEIDGRIRNESEFGYFIARQYVVKGEYLYIPFLVTSAVLKLNVISLENDILYVDTKSQGFSCICESVDGKFLLAGAGRNKDWIYLWDEKKVEIEKEWHVQETSDDYSVIKMLVSTCGDIYIFPWQNWGGLDVDVYKLNYCNMNLEKLDLLNDHNSGEAKPLWGDDIIHAHWIDEDRILFVTGRDYKWHEYNTKTSEHVVYDILFDELDENAGMVLKEYCRIMADYKKPLKEEVFGLKTFLNSIS